MIGKELTNAKGISNNGWDQNASDIFSLGVGNAIIQGFGAFGESYKQNIQSKLNVANYEAQADNLNFQANVAMQNMYRAYRQGEWQAMDMGLKDAQKIADIKTSTASSGVKMSSASKQELVTSQKLIHAQNQKALEDNIEAQTRNYRMQAVSLRNQALMAKGNAEAQSIMSSSWSPFINGFMTVGSGIAQAYLGANMYNKGLYSAKDAISR